MSNELLNSILAKWLTPPPDLAAKVNCFSCSRADREPAHAQRWRDYKCCAFQPFFANFLCGAMLEEGLLTFESEKFVPQPLGLIPAQEFRASCESVPDEERSEKHLCAFYDLSERKCSVWRYRPGECSLYFCTSNPQRELWSADAFALETGLAQMALAHLGFSPQAIAGQVDELNSPVSPGLEPKHAIEIYRAAWSYARTLDRSDVDSWLTRG